MVFSSGCLIPWSSINLFVQGVVRARRESSLASWKRWLEEDKSSRPYKWLRPDLVPPSPYLVCSEDITPYRSGVLVQPALIDGQFRKSWMPFFRREGRDLVTPDGFIQFVEGYLHQAPVLDLPVLTGDDLHSVVLSKKATSGGLDGWGWNELKALPLSWSVGLVLILREVENSGSWPQGLLDAYITMIPKADGDSTPLGQRPLCVLPVVYRLWASVRLGHIQKLFYSWVPDTVFSAGKGVSGVDAWYASSLDIEEVLSGAHDSQVHLFVADVIKSFDTVDIGILDCALGRLGLPGWFRKVYFAYHNEVGLRFKLATGVGEAWTRDGGIPQGCPLSMVFIVALYVPWCRYLADQVGVTPQLYADNLKCTCTDEVQLLSAARFTDRYIQAVGQEASPGKCVLLSTSRDTRKRMKRWSISFGDKGWAVKLDVRDLGGHLDVTNRARAHTLSCRADKATVGVHMVSALPFGFLGLVGNARSQFLPAGLHGCEGAPISIKKMDSFRTATVRACWPGKLPMANPHAVLSILDAPDVCDPALYVVWCRFRQLRRYLSYRPGEVARVYRLLDLVAAGRPGHGPLHLLLQSANELGFAWDSSVEGWIRPGLPPLRMLAGPYQHFKAAIIGAWRNKVSGILAARKGFRGGDFLDYPGSMQLLFSSHLRERDKMLLRSLLSGGVWNGFFLENPRRMMFLVGFVGVLMGMVICFGSVLSPLCAILGSTQSLPCSCSLIVVVGLGV